jgi:hypothetical protein
MLDSNLITLQCIVVSAFYSPYANNQTFTTRYIQFFPYKSFITKLEICTTEVNIFFVLTCVVQKSNSAIKALLHKV